ncbi:polysaccharide biosynthesis protein HfsE [Caulobacter endophyticus]|uniref:UDP-phosphate glucose phosphotransferase n=1 Tax=Caulobacter endophyticus TaxID=2172652 RepID=A0A2T9JU00_9CAUL|nr:exopolysaccharide biosynthesis polyprenyl glycosylphosphotransferase [Caulobacter endophyticus]PVM87178.1 UDP-phosphate glucose phosphotransferase [Caulobacter endophyticus]
MSSALARPADASPASAAAQSRRGPFRPERLTPARARVQIQNLTRAFRIVDSILAAAFALWLARDGGLAAPLVGAVVLLIALHGFEAYAFAHREPLTRHLLRVGAAIGASALAVQAVVLTPLVAGSLAAAGWVLAALPAFLAVHAAWWAVVRHGRRIGKLTPNIVLVGATTNAERLIAAALRTGEVNVLGVFDDRAARAPEAVLGVPVLGDTKALVDHRIMPFVDRVVIAVESTAQARVGQLVERLSELPNPVSMIVDVGGDADRDAALAHLADLSGAPTDARRAMVKRAQDLVIAGIGLIVAAPVMLGVALAVKLDSPGPIFFRQRRHGFNNETILIWKFRSMRHEMADARAARQISADDDRVTRVGKFIRRTSLDELPQLFNVLSGEMSIVGPRPHAIGMMTGDVESAKLVATYAHRHRMKPGVTGWAAIKGSRGAVDTPELVRQRVAYDVEYIERQSFWLDLYVILMTVPCLLGDNTAVR